MFGASGRSDTGRGRIVVGVSDSLAGLAALRRGVLEARRDGRTLVAVVAWEPPEGEVLYAKRPEPTWAMKWQREARLRLHRAFDEALGGIPADLRVLPRVIRGTPQAVLCAVADRPDDLLVIGAARSSGLRARVHRSPVRRSVLARAGCPVLTVPGPLLRRGEARALRRVASPGFLRAGGGRHETAA